MGDDGPPLAEPAPPSCSSNSLSGSMGMTELSTVAEAAMALVGLALDTKPGKHSLVIKPGEGSPARAHEAAFEVKTKQYPAQHLKVESRYVEPSAAEMERIRREQVDLLPGQPQNLDAVPLEARSDRAADKAGRAEHDDARRRPVLLVQVLEH